MIKNSRPCCGPTCSHQCRGNQSNKIAGGRPSSSRFMFCSSATFGRDLTSVTMRLAFDITTEDVYLPAIAARVLDPHFILHRAAAGAAHLVFGHESRRVEAGFGR